MTDIQAQVDAGQKKWGRGIDLQSDDTSIEDINDFVKFKTFKYKAYNFKDDELWEQYKEDFQHFTLQIFKDCNQLTIQRLRILLRNNGV